MNHPVRISTVTGKLPAMFDSLRQEACNEGYRFMERLAVDWASGVMRFDRDGELLLAAHLEGVLAGIGGITQQQMAAASNLSRRRKAI